MSLLYSYGRQNSTVVVGKGQNSSFLLYFVRNVFDDIFRSFKNVFRRVLFKYTRTCMMPSYNNSTYRRLLRRRNRYYLSSEFPELGRYRKLFRDRGDLIICRHTL